MSYLDGQEVMSGDQESERVATQYIIRLCVLERICSFLLSTILSVSFTSQCQDGEVHFSCAGFAGFG